VVNLRDLDAFEAGTVINEKLLRESNLIRGRFAGIKVLGDGELKHGLKLEVDKISATAREKIEKAGGTVTLRETRRAEESEAEVAPATTEQDVAATKAKLRVKKTKSRKKKSE
jgi:large subunit ribosomal protein L15